LRTPWKRPGGRLVVLAGTVVALVAVAVPLAVASGRTAQVCGATVKVAEHEKFVVNQYAQDGMRYVPGTVTVKSGCTLTFEFATPAQSESHSLSIVNRSDLPRTTAQMQSCKVCGQIAGRHVAHPGQPPGPANPIAHWIVNVGKPGLDMAGDSIVVDETKGAPPGHKRITVPVSAPAGSTLYYMCGMHPWMQAKIVVT
jgi:plastocyanin